MPCSKPISIINPHYRKLADIFHVSVRHFDQKEDYRITVPCGHCLSCLKKRQQNWFNRAHFIYMKRHLRPRDCYFCTFTLKPEVYEEAYEKPYIPIRRFIDRLRKHPSLKGRKLRFDYFFVVEFADGETARKRGVPSTHRMHYHAIFFGCPLTCQVVRNCWAQFNGYAKVERLKGEAGVRYTLKYMTKDRKACQHYLSDVDMRKNGKLVVSHGFARFDCEDVLHWRKFMLLNSRSFFCNYINNFPYSIPRYWKNQCFTKQELKDLHKELVPPLLLENLRRRFPYESERHLCLMLKCLFPWV